VSHTHIGRKSSSHSDDSLPGEFELIAQLTSGTKLSNRVILGPGDDCAILKRPPHAALFTIDSMVEGVHFDLRWGAPELLGARALEVNLSDIAAMGGEPTACVVNLGIRPGLGAEFFAKLNRGMRRAARDARVDIVGGNITRAEQLTITIALLGHSPKRPHRRDTARPGDDIFVTGTVGDAALGWRLLAGKLTLSESRVRRHLIDRALRPKARLLAGRKLAKLRVPVSAIDVSDGLLQDLAHVLERSRVGAEIATEEIPLSNAYREVAGGDLTYALSGGEDYELLFCLRPAYSARELSRRLGIAVTRIGRMVAARKLRLVDANGELVTHQFPKIGWDQLRDAD
jgi:thiamine-monophosphate kinase